MQDGMAIQIVLPERFDVGWMLNHIRTSSYGVPYRFIDRRILRRPLWQEDRPVVVEFDLSQTGTMKISLLCCPGDGAPPGRGNPSLHEGLVQQARFLWGLDDPADRHYAAMSTDPDLAPLFERFGELRIVRTPDLYEALLVTIIGQQVSVQAAQSIRRRLIQNGGMRVTAGTDPGGGDCYLYPPPQQLIDSGGSALRAHGVSRQKAAYLLEIAARAAAGELDRTAFAALSDEAAIARLCEIRGVGRWTAEIALMRGLGRADVFPAGDLALQAVVQGLRGMRERPSEKALRDIAERWKGWRSYAAFYLWMTLQSRAL